MTPEELNKRDFNAVIDAVCHISCVLMNDGKHEMNHGDREHLIDAMDTLTTMLASWYRIR
jgi:hypothetical protein